MDLKVGPDVAVASLDDDEIAVNLEPMLTTAAAPYEEMGSRAVQLLLHKDHVPSEHLIPMRLRVRGSVLFSNGANMLDEDEGSTTNWAR